MTFTLTQYRTRSEDIDHSAGFAHMVGGTIEVLNVAKSAEDMVQIGYVKDGARYMMSLRHYQDGSESVGIEDIEGDPLDMIGGRVAVADESTEDGDGTWTFYRILTDKGGLVIRFLGMSNGYYSEGVDTEVRRVRDMPSREDVLRTVKAGMTRDEVTSALGKPDEYDYGSRAKTKQAPGYSVYGDVRIEFEPGYRGRVV